MVRAHCGRAACVCLPLLMLAAAASHAHHGRDFLLTQNAHLPESGKIYGVARLDYTDEEHSKEWEFEPAVIGAVTDWLTLEAHSHIEKPKGESAEYESTAAAGYFRFTPRESAFALGASVEYEAARHSDDHDVWGFAGIASYQANGWLFGVNLLADRESGSDAGTDWGYAAGARRAINRKLAIAVEAAGSFEGDNEGEVLVGLFADPAPWLSVNIGAGTGFNGGADLTFRSALIFRFR